MAENYTIVKPDGSRSTATRITFLHEAATTRTIRAPRSTDVSVSGKTLQAITNGIIFHCFPEWGSEVDFLVWLDAVKNSEPKLPNPTKIKFKFANGIAQGPGVKAFKTIELRFATAEEAKTVVDFFIANPLGPCWCRIDEGFTQCPDGEPI